MLDESFRALADPTRREIIYLLAVTPSGMGIGEISNQFAVSRQGITKHLKILEQAGLLEIRKKGRQRTCYLNPLPMMPVMEWLEFYKTYWNEKLEEIDSLPSGD